MTWKTALAIFGGILGIICGEALKLGYTDWAQLGALPYWLGIGVQIASLIGVYCGGLYQAAPGDKSLKVDLTKIAPLLLVLLLIVPLGGCAAKSGLETRADVILSLDGVKTAVYGLQEAEHALYAGGTGVPTLAQHKAFNAKLVTIWPLLDEAVVVVQAWKPGDPVPAQVGAILQALTPLLQDAAGLVGTAIPEKVTAVWIQITKFLAVLGGVA